MGGDFYIIKVNMKEKLEKRLRNWRNEKYRYEGESDNFQYNRLYRKYNYLCIIERNYLKRKIRVYYIVCKNLNRILKLNIYFG